MNDRDYRVAMDDPMENLSYILFGLGNGDRKTDPEIVERAVKKIKMMKKMLEAAGIDKKVINEILASE